VRSYARRALEAAFVIWLGEAYLLAGRLDEASTQAQRALEFSRAHQERGNEAYALRLLGEVAAQRHPPGERAEAHYRQALALAEELGMRPLVAHCHQGLACYMPRPANARKHTPPCSLPSPCTATWR
jgi:tetratricopeptide (TPR) repeat protein